MFSEGMINLDFLKKMCYNQEKIILADRKDLTNMDINTNLILFVSGNGCDECGDGSFEKPFATVEAAQNVVKKAIKNGGLDSDAYIYVKGGTYFITETILIGAEDCDEKYTVHYMNYNNETVRFIGGVQIKGWSDPDGDGVFEADVSDNNDFYALYENGVCLTAARETDWVGKSVSDPSHLQAVYGSASSWFGDVLKVKSIDGDKIDTYIRKCDWSGDLQYLQGAREFITEPGEWAIEGNKVYYKPKDANSIENSEIIAGTVGNIFTVKGQDEKHVKNIVISGFSLEMNAFGKNLAAHARPHNVTAEYDTNLGALVYLSNAENITVKECRMSNAGYVGVVMQGYAQNNTVYGNDISQTGYAGIFMIGEDPGSLNYCSRCNTVSNNKIHEVGNFVGHGAGIYLMNSGENTVTHNEICNVPRYGISMKGMRYGVFADNGLGDVPFEDHWKYNQTTKNYFGFNKIYNTGIRSGDGGGIEGWGMGPYNHIDNNIIFNAYRGIPTTGWRGHSIFLDDACHKVKVTNNIVYDENAVAVNAGMFIKSIENYVVNNIFDIGYEKNGAADIQPFLCPAGGSVFKNNIVYSEVVGTLHDDGSFTEDGDNARVMYVLDDSANCGQKSAFDSLDEMNNNIYFNAKGETQFKIDGKLLSLEEWQNYEKNTHNYESDSIVADPMFVDALNHDYCLADDSPAIKLGFNPIDTSTVGLLPDYKF